MSLNIQLEPIYILSLIYIGFIWQVYKISKPIWRLPLLSKIEVYRWKDRYVMVFIAIVWALVHGKITGFLADRYDGFYKIPSYSIVDYTAMYAVTTLLYVLVFKFLQDFLKVVKRRWMAFGLVAVGFFVIWFVLWFFDFVVF